MVRMKKIAMTKGDLEEDDLVDNIEASLKAAFLYTF